MSKRCFVDVWMSFASLVDEGVWWRPSMAKEMRTDGLARGRTAVSMNRNANFCKRGGILRRGLGDLAATHLLGFEVLIQQVESLLVCSWATGDGEHALASVVMWSLGDRDAGT